MTFEKLIYAESGKIITGQSISETMNKFQKQVLDFSQQYKVQNKPQIALLDLLAELGEISKEILKATNYGTSKLRKNSKLIEEMGDAFFSMNVLGNSLGIDLLDALDIALKKYIHRYREKDTVGSDS